MHYQKRLDKIYGAELVTPSEIPEKYKVAFGEGGILTSMRSGRVKYVQFEVMTDTVYFINKNTALSMET